MTPGDEPQRRHAQEAGQQESRGRSGRSVAEWTTLAIGAFLILALVGLVTYLYVSGNNRPPVVEAMPLAREIRRAEGVYYVPIEVTNRGGRTAEDVVIQAELSTGEGAPEVTEFTIDFLAGDETAEGTVVFVSDPSAGALTVGVASFR
ncbi:MAG: TIGR02588 family protein [Chloroflexi bacterium]|nr:TIGR02588 family protein [Chloroflexota bacterium]